MRPFAIALATLVAALGATAAPAAAEVVDDNVAVAVRGETLVVFARAADGTLLMRDGVDAPWRSLGVEVSSGPSATTLGDGSILLFARGMDDRAAYTTIRDGTAASWQSLDGNISSAPAAGLRRGTDTVDLFARGTDGKLYHRTRTAGRWSAYGSRGFSVVGAPATASRKDNLVDVYVRGTDDELYASWNEQGTWYGPGPIGMRITAAPSVSALPGTESMNVFVRDASRALSQRYYDGERGFGPWAQVDPRPFSSAPTAVAGAGGVHVFARDEGDLILKSYEGSWKPWRSLGPVALPDEPAPGPGTPPPPPPPPPPPAPVEGGSVQLQSGIRCTPRGQKLKVSIKVRKRPGRAKPRVRKVVFYYRKGGQKIARSDRRAPYRKAIPIDLKPGTYRVFARIDYKRPGKRKLGRKTVTRRFVVCA